MSNKRLDLNRELSEYEDKSEKSIRAINNGIFFLTGIIVGLLPFAVMIMILIPYYNNNIVLNIFGLTFVVSYGVAICLMRWNNKVITKFLEKKWIAKYLYRPQARGK